MRFRQIIIFLLLSVLLAGCFSAGTNSNQTAPPPVEIPASSVDLAKPLQLSTKSEDVALAKKLDEMIDKSEFRDARWGLFVVSLKDGRIVAARDAQKLFNPASVQKVITSVVSLDRLGADFRWQTRLYAKANPENGVIEGDLTLYGEGAPDLNDEGIARLATQLKAKGVTKIKGNIVGDESYFTGDSIGDGWAWNELQWYYGAQASALSVNKNLVNLSLENGRPKVEPAVDFVEVAGEVPASPNGAPDSIGVKRGLGNNKVYVWGEGRNLDVRVAVDNPALWSAKLLKEALVKNGIAVAGDARSADWQSAAKLSPETAVELARIESQTLGEIVTKMNKDSVNLYAELILRTLGRKFGAEAPDLNPKARKTRGDDMAGADVIRKWLADNGVSLQETETVKDGSGLSRLNFVTPETIGRALIAGNQIKAAEVFRGSLPVAGGEGTLRGRLAGTGGKIAAKTGSIMFVNTLAGYAKGADETLAFVILCNNETRKADNTPLIDALAAELLR